jgi:hypothetical protein
VKEAGSPGAGAGKQSKSISQTPAVQALLLQVVSLIVVLLLNAAFAAFFDVTVNVFAAAGVQGVCAALLSKWRGLAPWWLAIQLLFPLALVLASALQLPPWIFLLAFFFLLLLYWTSFRTQVPFYPSGPVVWEKVAELVPEDRDIALVDIGSGLGGLLLHLARRFPGSRFVGVELAPLPWLISCLRARLGGSAVRFDRCDYNRLHLGEYDVVFAYLSPAAMPDLWTKARKEMRKGGMLISYEFAIPGIAPSMIISPRFNAAKLHVFHM